MCHSIGELNYFKFNENVNISVMKRRGKRHNKQLPTTANCALGDSNKATGHIMRNGALNNKKKKHTNVYPLTVWEWSQFDIFGIRKKIINVNRY